ncbi:MAG TPA: macrolide ABC transporter ATP-binding protein, partial [Enterococcus sp.]|nr:macrolide ABC transporter ATP-binding protein [Enterococcus sp.]
RREHGNTVLIITHNSALAPIADRVIRINDAKVRSVEINDTPSSIDDLVW